MAQPVVMIHGMWCTGANFERLQSALEARGFQCHAPSLPHHQRGQDNPEVGALSLRDYVDFLEDFVKQQQFTEAPVLIGHSMGGLLAQQLAARISPAALVLLNPAPPWGVFGIRWSNFIAFLRVFLRWGWWRKPHKPSFERARTSAFNAGVPRERMRPLYEGLVPESGRAVFEIGYWYLDRARASAVDNDAIRCPVYVVSCGKDRLTPASVVRASVRRYPHAALRHYPDRGHWVLDDVDAEEMNTDIANWIQGQVRRLGHARAAA